MRDWDLDDVIACVVGVILLVSIIAGLAWMTWADTTQQCFGPAYDSYRLACVNGHAVPR